MISIQTNIDSLLAQQNLNVNNQFQSNTIQQLTSGYRINSSADDAAGLSVANGYRNQIAELNQGILNANQGVSQLQIVDGGLSNISQMLDRLQTLATESASDTFTGNRDTLNNEYQGLLFEIDRQANNIGLGDQNKVYAANLQVFIGGGQSASQNSSVDVNLNNSSVSSAGLGLAGTNVLDSYGVQAGAAVATAIQPGQTDTFTIATASGPNTITLTGQAGDTVQSQVEELNTKLNALGLNISASISGTGNLQFQSSGAFTVWADSSNPNASDLVASSAGTIDTAVNQGLNTLAYAAQPGDDLTITVGSTTATIASLASVDQTGVNQINAALQAAGITGVTAVLDETSVPGGTPTGISLQGASVFTATANGSVLTGTVGAQKGGPPTATLNAITQAVQNLGTVQGIVGAGENTLNYAINLAQSQITSFSAAQSQIRDANVAAEAANMTKAQVLEQASIAAMAQANQEPQAVLALLKQ